MPALTITAVDTATNQLTVTAHGLLTGDGPAAVRNEGGALPAPLAAVTDYWVIRVDANTLKLATSSANANAGTAIDITSAGTGTNKLEYGIPYRRDRTYASLSQVRSLDFNRWQDSHVALYGLLTAQAQSIYDGIKLESGKHVTLSGTGEYKHGEKKLNWFPPHIFRDTGSELKTPTLWTGDAMRIAIAGSGGIHRVPGPPLRSGWRLKKIDYEFNSTTDPAADAVIIQKYDGGTSHAITVSGTSPFRTYTLNTPYTVTDGDVLWLKITPGTAAIDFQIFWLTYDIV